MPNASTLQLRSSEASWPYRTQELDPLDDEACQVLSPNGLGDHLGEGFLRDVQIGHQSEPMLGLHR